MLDLQPATAMLSELLAGVRDDQLASTTPCEGTKLGALIDHVDSFSMAFTAAATKTPLPGPAPTPDASRLGSDWHIRVPDRLAGLADAWRDETAWTGMTQAGGLDLPAEIAAAVALDEVIVHGWDIAAATGQRFRCPDELVQGALEFVRPTVAQNPDGTPGLFGPPVPIPDDAPLLDRLLGLTGRDPDWHSASHS